MIPPDLRYSSDHEWVRLDGETATVGITQYAADELGDVVFVELPAAGRTFSRHSTFGVVESVKAVSDLYIPIDVEVLGSNDALGAEPELVNADPYGLGWMVRVRVTDPKQLADLLDATAYERLTAKA